MSSILATLICTDAWSLAPMMVLEAELFGVEEGGGRGERKGEGYFPVRREACSQRGRLPCMFVLGYTGTSFGKRCEDERVGKSETVISSSSFFFSPLFLSSLCATPQHSAAYPPGTQLTVVCEFANKKQSAAHSSAVCRDGLTTVAWRWRKSTVSNMLSQLHICTRTRPKSTTKQVNPTAFTMSASLCCCVGSTRQQACLWELRRPYSTCPLFLVPLPIQTPQDQELLFDSRAF